MEKITVSAEHFVYHMSKENKPGVQGKSGQRFVFETSDCFHDQIISQDQSIDGVDWERINPATGPVFIEGAEPGDTLKITIEEIVVADQGLLAVIPEVGVLGDETFSSEVKMIPIVGENAIFSDRIQLPIRPMVGVIGTAPLYEAVSCGTPGAHGGNLDCKEITAGSVVYLPVFHTGGLLALGDLHACMGDGELLGTGIEIAGRVTVLVEVVRGLGLKDPALETAEYVYTIASAETLEQAVREATKALRDRLSEHLQMDRNSVGMLISAAADIDICQAVNPLVTVRCGISKKWVGAHFFD